MKTGKRLLSLFLVMAMVLSWLPASVLATENQAGSSAVQEAVQSVEEIVPTETTAQIAQQNTEFEFVEPGRENDEPVGDVIITDSAYRIQLNPNLSSYTILEYMGSAANVVIPSEYNGLPITRIGAYAFQGKTRMTTVSIPETVTRIEEGVFDGCKRLTYHIYEGGKYLGSPTNPYYYYCGPQDTSLTEAAMHEDTKLVAAFAFRGCESLKTVTVPDGVIQVGYGMLFGCDVESVTLPFVGELGTDRNPQFGWVFGARSMGGNISYVPLSLKTVVINGGQSIAQGAFYGVDMIESITLPYLGGSADSTTNTFLTYYWGADSYTQNILPESVKYVNILGGKYLSYPFYNCTGIESLSVSAVGYFSDKIIKGCTGLQEVHVGEGAYAIASDAFLNGTKLERITLGKGLKTIGTGAFTYCTALTQIVIPEGVTTIESSAFMDCSSLISVSIPSTVVSIGAGAFYNCTSLEKVYISDIVSWCEIEFANQTSNPLHSGAGLYLDGEEITHLQIPSGATMVSDYAFYNCSSLKSVIVPDTVTDMGESVFCGCTSLVSVVLPKNLAALERYTFQGCSSLIDVSIPDGVTSIEQSAFEDCISLRSVDIPESVSSIKSYVFQGCSSMKSIVLPDGLQVICDSTFYGCSSLTDILIPESVTTIEQSAFAYCSSLVDIMLPKNLETLGRYAFRSCSRLTSIEIPEEITSIGDSTFYQCSSLVSIKIPDSVTSIGTYAFYQCGNLEAVTIPEGVPSIGNYTFYNCSKLSSITIPSSVTSIGSYAFYMCSKLYIIKNNSSLALSFGSTANGYVANYAKMITDSDGTVRYKSGTTGYEVIDTEDGFRFVLENGTYTLKEYLGTENTVILPLDINGNSYTIKQLRGVCHVILPEGMTEVPSSAFYGCNTLESVVIPEGVTKIGSNAFYGCDHLTSIRLPESLTQIGEYAFRNCTGLREIAIPASVTTLTRYAFYGCTGLEDVYIADLEAWCKISFGSSDANPLNFAKKLYINGVQSSDLIIPEGVTTLRSYVFNGCSGIVGIHLPASMQTISSNSISATARVTIEDDNPYLQIVDGIIYDKPITKIIYVTGQLPENVVIEEGVTTVTSSHFSGRTNLVSIKLPDTLTSISASAFKDCLNLISVDIPETVTSIGNYAFSGCSNLSVVTIPQKISSLGNYVFYGCSGLKDVTVPAGARFVTASMFEGCISLTEVVLESGLIEIGSNAFYGCSSLKSISVPDSVTRIYDSAFRNCAELVDVTLPDTLSTLSDSVFQECGSLTQITIPTSVTWISNYLFQDCSSLKTVNMHDSLTAIGDHAFQNCDALTTITIPAGITAIGGSAFQDCGALTKVVLPDTVTSIGNNAFKDCVALTNITLPAGLTSLSFSVFYNCKALKHITLPYGVTSVEGSLFYGCSSLESVTILGSVSSLGNNAFYGCENLQRLNIYDVSAWCQATFSNDVANPLYYAGELYVDDVLAQELIITGSVTAVSAYAFYNCSSLTSISLPDGVTKIDRWAFANCSNLKYAQLPDSVTAFGQSVFENCTNLISVNIPKGVTNTSYYTFRGCSNLTSVSIPEGLTTIGNYAFYGCKELTDITIPTTLTTIGSFAFYGCSSISTITIPATVKTVSQYAFRECTGLIEVTVQEGVTSIGSSAFYGCSRLTSITIPSTVTSISSSAFSGCTNLYQVVNNSSLALAIGKTTYGSAAYYAKVLFDKNGTATYKNAESEFALIDTEEGFRFARENGQYTLLAYMGDQETVALPTVIMGEAYQIKCLAGARSMILPDSVTVLDSGAFSDCVRTTCITLPKNIEKIEINALPANLSVILSDENEYFQMMDGILYDTALSQLVYVSADIAADVTIPESISIIPENAFINSSGLVRVTLPRGVVVEDGAFSGCAALEKVELTGVRQLGERVFSGCNKLTQLVYDGECNEWRYTMKATNWDEGMPSCTIHFAENTGYFFETDSEFNYFYISDFEGEKIELDVPQAYSGRPVTAVLSNAFGGNESVQAITLPETVTYIGENAFVNCTELESMVFPESLTQMQRGVLSGCDSLAQLTIPFLGMCRQVNDTSYLGYTFGAYSYKENASYLPGALTAVTVTDVDAIGDYAFYDCMDLETVNLPETVTSIGEAAFSGCMAMEEIGLPQKLETVGSRAFSGCSDLAAIILPDSVTKVGEMILEGCDSLTAIIIGAGLTYQGVADLGNEKPLFGIDKSASRLKTYQVAAGNPDFAAIDNILYHTLTIDGEAVPVEVVDAPAQANLRNYDMPELIVKIGAYAFAYNNTLRGIDLEYVRMVGNNAFYKAENLIYANFGTGDQEVPAGVDAISYDQYVGKQAFMGCVSLQTVNLDSEMLIGIGEDAFADCEALTSIELGKNIQSLGIGAFGSSGTGGSNLEEFWVDPENSYLESIDGVLYQEHSDGTLTLLVYPAMSYAFTQEEGKNVFRVPTDRVTAIESYAFRMSQELDTVYLQPENPMKVGDYAFANSKLERVYIGENVTSLGLKRGEGEYTVFSECDYLVELQVEDGNQYYSSENGVLFDKNQTKLIKYPAAKAGTVYKVPDTVSMIASMAFKDNAQVRYVHVVSEVHTVGLEAFYGCTNLALIFFDGVYAPTAVLENAFTTYDSVNEAHMANPRTKLGYSEGYYLDGAGYGWKNYEDVYDLTLCQALPETENRSGNEFYAVVVVDSEGRRLDQVHVTLTDPNGNSETVATGSDGAAVGTAMFYDLFEAAGMGFAVTFDGTYSLKVTDPEGEYFTYVNPSFYLDRDMRITYVTLTQLPSIYGTSCGETDINTEGAEINKAEYGYTNVELIDESLGFVEGNIKKTEQVKEYVDISVIAYCDSHSGWAFTDDKGQLLDAAGGLYQNGVKVSDVTDVQVQEDSVLFTFHTDVSELIPEVEVEARLTAFGADDASYTCSTVLNIHVFDFIVTEDDVQLDAQELEVDLAAENKTLAKLFGSNTLDVSLGKDLSFGVSVDGSRVEMTLGYEKSKSKDKGAEKRYASYQEGYESNRYGSTGNTYEFEFYGVYVDEDYQDHLLKYIVRIARGTEKSNYFYYRCYVYEGEYKNEVAEFYGVVNGLSDNVAKLVGAKTYKERVAPKAALIYLTHLACANKDADELKDIKDLESEAKYVEAREEQSVVSNSHSLDVELQGKLIFEYDKENGLIPVSSEIHGELYYTFKHNSQFVVWVIPVVLQVEVKVGGEVDITLKFDENRKISMDEAKLTISAAISAKVGVGCSVASVGVYGSIGTVFVLDFYPEFGVDSWTLNGEIGAYMRILWYTKKFSIAKFDNVQLVSVQSEELAQVSDMVSALYLAENYSAEDLGVCDGNARIVALGEEIYKVFYVDASGLAGYDSYNYQKLAIAKWNGSDWEQPVMVDDNGLNDAQYALYSNGQQTYMVYTQQTQRLDETSADDTYASSANMAVKLACITDPANVTVSSVAEGTDYKYLPTITETESGLMAVWAENSDNNMFGVSPYNYIDANGQSHVFETTANSIYASTLTEGQWQTPVCLRSGLSAVTDLAAAEDGSVCYIVDGNGDLGDDTDRVLWHLGADGKAAAVNSTGSVTGVEAADGVYTYYLSGEQSSGLRQLDPQGGQTQVLPDIDNLTDNYKLLYDESGAAVAVFYTAVKTWQEADTTVDGSAMYGVFCNEGQWGEPVEISAFPAESDVYISFFDALYRSEDQVMLMADFVDRDGNMLYSLTEQAYALTSALRVVDYEMDYVNQIMDITVTNSGARPAAVYIGLDGGVPVAYGEPVGSGATADISVSLADCGLQPAVQVFADSTGSPVATISDLDLNYSDVVPLVKQLLLGKENRLLVAVKNTGNLDNSGCLLVRAGNYDAQTIDAESLLAMVDTAALVSGQAVSVTDAQGVPFWVVKYQAVSGGVQYVEIPLTDEAFAGTEGLITLYASVDQDTEKGQAADNNITYASYQALTGVLAEGETVAALPELQTQWLEYDGQDSVTIPFTCGSEDTVQAVTLNGEAVTDYTAQCQDGTGTLTVPGQTFENLAAGEYTLTVSFAAQVCTLTVSVPKYYTVTWVSEGQTVCTTQVKHGDIPYISSIPTKEDSQDTRYAFVGWSLDGSTVGTQAVTADTTYYAVWGEDAKAYTVTWVLSGINGAPVQVQESYSYNAVPRYTGTLPAPTGKVFTGWDQELAPVTADAVYTARYAGLALYENGEQKTGYTSLTQIMADYDPASQYIRLTEDARIDLVLTRELYIDLAGFDLTGRLVTNGFKVYGMDSTTDGYSSDNMGCFDCVDAEGNAIVPETQFKTDVTGSVKRYMAIVTDDGYTFHRFYLGITALSLQPNVTGFGYKAEFYGDAMVQEQLESIGYSLWLTEDRVIRRSTDQFKNVLTLRLKNFDVANYGETPVNASVTMTLTDGTVIESAVSSRSMRDVVEAVAASFDSYTTTQKQAVKAMCEKYAAMSDWDISNILTWTEET